VSSQVRYIGVWINGTPYGLVTPCSEIHNLDHIEIGVTSEGQVWWSIPSNPDCAGLLRSDEDLELEGNLFARTFANESAMNVWIAHKSNPNLDSTTSVVFEDENFDSISVAFGSLAEQPITAHA